VTVSFLLLVKVPLINIAVGNLVGGIVRGVMTDIWAKRQARRNHGVFEPEARLTLFIFIAS